MLKQRLITAAILIFITLLILFYTSSPVFCVITGLIALAGSWEWSRLMGLKRLPLRIFYLIFAACIFVLVLFIPASYILITGFVWWVIAFLLLILYSFNRKGIIKSPMAKGIMGLLVLIPCWATINYIRNQEDGIYALLFLLILISCADSIAYFAGRKWGKHLLAPKISPGKTVEGLIVALTFSMLIAVIIFALSKIPPEQWLYGIALSFITVIFSIIGDLFESMIKRQAEVKDSGTLLPGHGGVLDRIDSLTAAAPVFAFGSWLLGMYLS